MLKSTLLLCCLSSFCIALQAVSQTRFQTDHLVIALNDKGFLDALEPAGLEPGTVYLAKGEPAPLLSVRMAGRIHFPGTLVFDATQSILELEYPEPGIMARILATVHPTHVTFELIWIEREDDVELLIWGPYPTTIGEIVGETVGVVRNRDYAIGIQALNVKTLGGYPTTEDDVMPMYNIFAGSDYSDIAEDAREKELYRGDTAKPTDFGSVLQAFTRNRRKERIIANWGHEKYHIPALDDGVVGSRIALFGCPASKALETIGRIETAEGLPHPIIDGVWGKVSPGATASYLIIGFGEDTIDEAIRLTKEAGLRYLYHGGPFATWGHFALNPKPFPNGWKGLKACVDKARQAGLRVGVHTLSNFITTNDPYVTPVPDPRLAKVGTSILSADVDAAAKEILVADPSWFDQMKNNTLHTVMAGAELIRYGSVSKTPPWRLLDCERGAFGTRQAPHRAGDEIGKLMDHPYQTFLADMWMQEEVAGRLADLFNETGLMQISFDGLEGCWAGGHGQYARTRFVKTWYDHLIDDRRGHVITDASNPGHFFWHIYTRMNWGEPWYAGFRESQTQYRLKNQRYFRRNLMPCMLGWFKMTGATSLEDAEWLLARAAGFDAGFCLVTDPALVRQNGRGGAILKAIKTWEAARLAGAFMQDQKARLRDINQEFHLVPAGSETWDLYPVHSVKGNCKGEAPSGEASAVLEVNNPIGSQSLYFTLQAKGDTRAEKLSLKIDGKTELPLPAILEPGDILQYEGGSDAVLYDGNWNETGRVAVDPEALEVGEGSRTVRLRCRLSGDKDPAVKIEYRLFAAPENVRVPQR